MDEGGDIPPEGSGVGRGRIDEDDPFNPSLALPVSEDVS